MEDEEEIEVEHDGGKGMLGGGIDPKRPDRGRRVGVPVQQVVHGELDETNASMEAAGELVLGGGGGNRIAAP